MLCAVCVCLTSFHQIPFNSVEVLLRFLRLLLMLLGECVVTVVAFILRSPQSLSHSVAIWVLCVCVCLATVHAQIIDMYFYMLKRCAILVYRPNNKKKQFFWCRFFCWLLCLSSKCKVKNNNNRY